MAPMLSTFGGGSARGFGSGLPSGEDLWFTNHGTGTPSFDLTSGSLVWSDNTNQTRCYSGCVDTFGHYGVFGFRSGHPVEVIDLELGTKVYQWSNGTLNGANGYGVGFDSVRGYIYFCEYNTTTIWRLNLGSDFTGTTDGTKGTFNNAGGSRSNYTTQSWGWGRNDGIAHVYLPHDTSHYLHDKYIMYSRANGTEVRIMNAGTSPSVLASAASTSGSDGKYGSGFDWSTMATVSSDRSNDVEFNYFNSSSNQFNGGTTNVDYSSYTPSGSGVYSWYSTEDAFIANNGDLIICSGNANRYFWRYPRI